MPRPIAPKAAAANDDPRIEPSPKLCTANCPAARAAPMVEPSRTRMFIEATPVCDESSRAAAAAAFEAAVFAAFAAVSASSAAWRRFREATACSMAGTTAMPDFADSLSSLFRKVAAAPLSLAAAWNASSAAAPRAAKSCILETASFCSDFNCEKSALTPTLTR